jgi:hypothetical protein
MRIGEAVEAVVQLALDLHQAGFLSGAELGAVVSATARLE